jgi:hypothetical protein
MDPRAAGATRNPAAAWLCDDRYSVLLAAMIWALIVLMIVPEGFDYQALTIGSVPSSGGVLSRMLWLVLLASGFVVVCWRVARSFSGCTAG